MSKLVIVEWLAGATGQVHVQGHEKPGDWCIGAGVIRAVSSFHLQVALSRELCMGCPWELLYTE